MPSPVVLPVLSWHGSDFVIFPHLDHEMLPENTMAHAEKWAARLSVPGYAMDDETAIKVVDGVAEVISEGHWKLFTPNGGTNSKVDNAARSGCPNPGQKRRI